jgi:hypothetical protein
MGATDARNPPSGAEIPVLLITKSCFELFTTSLTKSERLSLANNMSGIRSK